MSTIETPKLIKIEHHYQIVRTALNIVGIILMIFALIRLNTILDQIRANQNTILCIVKESTNPKYTTIDPKTLKFTIDNSYIDRCVEANK